MSKFERTDQLSLESSPGRWRTALRSGNRFALARLLTFSESRVSAHRQLVDEVIAAEVQTPVQRVGVTGAPGVGKSTLLESLGRALVADGKRICVLSVDPSSPRTGGSILGDKTRMTGLSTLEGAYVRSVPSGTALGGVSWGMDRSLALCEGADFDVIFVETVGVGQSEVDVFSLVDCLLLLVSPAAGDELQGFKRGLMEHVDVVGVTKTDLHPKWAEITLGAYLSALGILRPKSGAQGLTLDGLSGEGVRSLWEVVKGFQVSLESRAERTKAAGDLVFWREMTERLKDFIEKPPSGPSKRLEKVLRLRAEGRLTPSEAAERVIALFRVI